MYIEQLINTFTEIAANSIPELNNPTFIQNLAEEIKNNKYDLQDQTFIETALADDKGSFIESFTELFENTIRKTDNREQFLKSEEGKKEVTRIYIKNIDYTVDFFYNAIISKQFSET